MTPGVGRAREGTADGRISSGIPGLDAAIGGGYPEKGSVIIAGAPGTGKTVFAMQYLHENASKNGLAAMYISFGTSKSALYSDMLKFGWDFAALEKEKKFSFVDYPPHEIERFLIEGGVVEDIVRMNDVKVVALDSITYFMMMYDTDYKRRQAFLRLLEVLRKWGCTSVIVSEGEEKGESVAVPYMISHLSDVMLTVRAEYGKSETEYPVRILKVKGGAHRPSAVLKFGEDGLSASK